MKRLSPYDKAVVRYCVGAVLAALITVIIYVIVVNDVVQQSIAVAAIILVFAVIQLVLQLVVFLHIKEGDKPRWKLHSIWFVAATVLIVVVGSIWIMKNLDYNMGMTGEQMHEYMLKENQKGF